MFFKFRLTQDYDGLQQGTVGIAMSAPRGSAPGMAQFIIEGQNQPVLIPQRLLEALQ